MEVTFYAVLFASQLILDFKNSVQRIEFSKGVNR